MEVSPYDDPLAPKDDVLLTSLNGALLPISYHTENDARGSKRASRGFAAIQRMMHTATGCMLVGQGTCLQGRKHHVAVAWRNNASWLIRGCGAALIRAPHKHLMIHWS